MYNVQYSTEVFGALEPLYRFLAISPKRMQISTPNVQHPLSHQFHTLFRRRLSAEGAKPESNNRWKSELGHVCRYVCMYGILNYLANQGT